MAGKEGMLLGVKLKQCQLGMPLVLKGGSVKIRRNKIATNRLWLLEFRAQKQKRQPRLQATSALLRILQPALPQMSTHLLRLVTTKYNGFNLGRGETPDMNVGKLYQPKAIPTSSQGRNESNRLALNQPKLVGKARVNSLLAFTQER